uniref:Uncharacterized protein n=1 Tax=Glossina pallidipes TaxID=7398 RepID=A0A1B0A6Q2_GLOPL
MLVISGMFLHGDVLLAARICYDFYIFYHIYKQLNYLLNSEQHLSIMAPMPTSKKPNNANPNFLYATNVSDGSSSPTSSSPPSSTDPAKSQCSSLSDGESFEGYGENELGSIHLNHGGQLHDGSNSERKINLNGSGVELELKPHSGHSSTPQQQDDDLNILPRDNWARMSLRRTPNSSTKGRQNRSTFALKVLRLNQSTSGFIIKRLANRTKIDCANLVLLTIYQPINFTEFRIRKKPERIKNEELWIKKETKKKLSILLSYSNPDSLANRRWGSMRQFNAENLNIN